MSDAKKQDAPDQTDEQDVDVSKLGMDEVLALDEGKETPAPDAPADDKKDTKEPAPEPAKKDADPSKTEPSKEDIPEKVDPKEYVKIKGQVDGSRKAYYEENKRRKAAEARMAEMERERLTKKAEFKELSPEDVADLKSEDRDAYNEYLDQKEEATKSKGDLETFEKNQAAAQEQEFLQTLTVNAFDAMSRILGIEIDSADPSKLPKEVTEFLESPEGKAWQQIIDETYTSVGKMPTANQMLMVYKGQNFEKLAAIHNARQTANTISNINKAERGGSQFDRVPSDSTPSKTVRYEEMSPEQWEKAVASASPEELVTMEKWVDEKNK